MSDERNLCLDLFEAQPAPWDTPVPEVPAIKPRIQIPGKNRTMSAFAAELGQQLANRQLYVKGETIIAPNEGTKQFEELTPNKFVTWLEDFVECYEGQPNEDGSGTNVKSINSAVANTVLQSNQFRKSIPSVVKTNLVRQPVFDDAGALRLLPGGFDAATKTLTARNSVQYPLNLTAEQARHTIDGLLEEFCFADAEYGRAVQVAAMLTTYGMDLLSDTCVIPAFVYNANAEGCGKGLCVKLALAPVFGEAAATAPVKSEDELERRLFAVAKGGDRFLFIDNLAIPLRSPSLEMFLTASHIKGRTLGTSFVSSYAKKTAVFVTGNHLTMSPDMRRRSLVVDFFLREVRAEVRQIQRPLDEKRILATRAQILGSLYALVRDWVAAGKPQSTRCHPSFVEWSNVVAAIVEHAGYANPVPRLDVAAAVDPETAHMERLVALMGAAANPFGLTFGAVVDLCREHGLFDTLLPTAGAERRGNTQFGRLLKRFDQRHFLGRLRFRLLGEGHQRRYAVENLGGEADDGLAAAEATDHANHADQDQRGEHDRHDQHDPMEVEGGTAVAA